MASRVKGKPDSPPRRYDASWRRAQTRETQRHIAETARALFLERGYGATSIREIADAAGVAVQTIYNAFDGKPAIVARIADMAIVGDDEPVALVDRPHVQAIRQGTDAGDMVQQWASLCRGIFTRFLPLLPILAEAAAADPAVRALWRNNAVINRYEETKIFVTHLATLVELPEGLDIERATDLLWTYASFHTAEALIVERGWTPDDYETWTAQAICRILGIDAGKPAPPLDS
jgi:TetR/AcrR family transcriptional regulator of autoinduction and epiphytic fitness